MQPLSKWRISFTHQCRRPSRFFILPFLLLTLFVSITLSIGSSVHPVVADVVDFVEEFRGIGRYGIVAKGVGTRGDPATGAWTGSGDIDIDIPASATIHEARLIWTGRTREQPSGAPTFDADGVQLSIDGGPNTHITAGTQYFQDPWFPFGGLEVEQLHESADITALMVTGSHTYTVSDHEHGLAPDTGNDLNYGVGIWVVYEDAGEELGEVIVYEGQDSFFRNWTPPRGPNTNVRCADFTADVQDRTVDITHLVSGVDLLSDPNGLRSDAFWLLTGSSPTDTQPPPDEDPGIIGAAIGYDPLGQYPLRSSAGLEWDNLETKGFPVPAGDNWVCFQIESGDSQDLAGLGNAGTHASGMWNLFAIRIYVATSDVDLISFNGRSDTNKNVTLRWETAD
ncbi:MAG: hypothetical protein KC421_25380, partial [Anaerolineales bacterium]|nr:hypothetical protein [Anaerolineales bacterium]